MGDKLSVISTRRGRIEGMEDIGGGKMVRAYASCRDVRLFHRSAFQDRAVVTTLCSLINMSRYSEERTGKLFSSKGKIRTVSFSCGKDF